MIMNKKTAFRILILCFLFIKNSGILLAQTSPVTHETAGVYEFTVPCGVTSISVRVWGAGGGGRSAGAGGGAGALLRGTITTTPGEKLYILVGSGGSNSTGVCAYGGGGTGGAGGGGASGIFTDATCTAAAAIVIAAGGAGGGHLSAAGGGGAGHAVNASSTRDGANGSDFSGQEGGFGAKGSSSGYAGGTSPLQASPGTSGGTGIKYSNSTALNGGAGAVVGLNRGGGGGGGYYGGGGGSASSNLTYKSFGGGGGCSYMGSRFTFVQSAFGNNGTSTAGGRNSASGFSPGDPYYSYNVTAQGGSPGNSGQPGKVVVTWSSTSPSATVSSGSSSPTSCINTSMSTTWTTSNTTGIGTPSGLPNQVTPNWSSNTLTLSGTPNVSGAYSYSIPLLPLCSGVNVTGTITVSSNNTVSSASASSPTFCTGIAITDITFNTTGATGIDVNSLSLPSGIQANFISNTNTLRISGTTSQTGSYPYSIPLTGGCGNISASGSFKVLTNPNLSNFNSPITTYFGGYYSIAPPTSDSTALITYTSNNTNVATIDGNTVNIIGPGTANIVATQAENTEYCGTSISSSLIVNDITIVTKNGKISKTNTNYVNNYGKINKQKTVNKNGLILTAKTIPIIEYTDIVNLSSDSATASSNIILDGGFSISGRGFCWNTTGNPTINNFTLAETGTTGSFSSILSNLSSSVTYYVCAYVTTNLGTFYGNEISFTKP
jgi:hypothetical protein